MTRKEKARKALLDTPDSDLQEFMFAVSNTGDVAALEGSISYGRRVTAVDEDGFSIASDTLPGTTEHMMTTIRDLQQECWIKFNTNPQISTSITDNGGIVCGKGFGVHSPYQDVQEWLSNFVEDPRNRLYSGFKKLYTRSEIEGELFLSFTTHTDGFVEVDFLDPGSLVKIHVHPSKRTMPLFYEFNIYGEDGTDESIKTTIIPSIFLFYYPQLLPVAKKLSA